MQMKMNNRMTWLAVGAVALTLGACNSSNNTPPEPTPVEAPQTVAAPPAAEAGAPSNDVLIEAIRTAKIAEATDPAQQEGLRTASITPRGACAKDGTSYSCPVSITMELETGAVNTNETARLTQDASGKWVATK